MDAAGWFLVFVVMLVFVFLIGVWLPALLGHDNRGLPDEPVSES